MALYKEGAVLLEVRNARRKRGSNSAAWGSVGTLAIFGYQRALTAGAGGARAHVSWLSTVLPRE